MRTLWRLTSDQNCTRQFCAASLLRLEILKQYGIVPRAAHWLFFLALLPALAKALGLGNLDIQTHVEQPLRAHIELIAVNPDELDQIQVRLADQKDFEWIGIERTSELEQLRFTLRVDESGIPTIAVTTVQPLKQDSLNFLIEVRWPEGRLLREYAIQLKSLITDYGPSPVDGNPPIEQAVPSKNISPPNPTTLSTEQTVVDASASSPQISDTPTTPALINPYTTVRGDTLYKIARKYSPDGEVNTRKMVLALFRANPDAFNDGNINNLKANVPLRIPDPNEIEELGRQPPPIEATVATLEPVGEATQSTNEAIMVKDEPEQEIRPEIPSTPSPGGDVSSQEPPSVDTQVTESQQETQGSEKPDKQAPQAAQTDPYLEIIAAKPELEESEPESKAEAVSANDHIANLENTVTLAQELAESRKQENKELKSRLQELEKMLSRQERLITLQSTQLAEIQKAALATAQHATPIIWQWVLITLIGLTIMLMVLVLRLYRRD